MTKRHPRTTVKPEYISIELQAMALLFDHASTFVAVGPQRDRWMAKLVALREAMPIGLREPEKRGPISHFVAPEIVQDEQLSITQLVDCACDRLGGRQSCAELQRDLDDLRVEILIRDGKRQYPLHRRLPLTQTLETELIQHLIRRPGFVTPSRSSLINQIVGLRLGVQAETVKNLQGWERELGGPISDRTPLQRALASLYLDAIAVGASDLVVANLLDALIAAKYNMWMLYYLVQVAHSIPKCSLPRIKPEELAAFASIVRIELGEGRAGPFRSRFEREPGSDVASTSRETREDPR